MSSSSANQVQGKFKNEFVKGQTSTDPKVLTDELSAIAMKDEFDQKLDKFSEVINHEFSKVNRQILNLLYIMSLKVVPDSENDKMEKDDATDAGNGSDLPSHSESSLDDDEELLDDITTPMSSALGKSNGHGFSLVKIKKDVSNEIQDIQDQLKKLPDLSSNTTIIAKYQKVFDIIYMNIPNFKEVVLNDFEINTTTDETTFFEGYTDANKIFYYKFAAEKIERLLRIQTRDVLRNDDERINLKKIINYIESHRNDDASVQIIDYIRKVKKSHGLIKTSALETDRQNLKSTTERRIIQFFQTIDSTDFMYYFMYVDVNNESNVKVLGRQLNKQYQAFIKDPSYTAPSLETTLQMMRTDSALIEPSGNQYDKQSNNKKHNSHGHKRIQNNTESQKYNGNKNVNN